MKKKKNMQNNEMANSLVKPTENMYVIFIFQSQNCFMLRQILIDFFYQKDEICYINSENNDCFLEPKIRLIKMIDVYQTKMF